MNRALRRRMSTRAALVAAALSISACTTAAQARRAALEDATIVDRELDLLYECALATLDGQELAVARSDASARVAQSEWVADADERWRMTVLVRVHPRFGPGADAVVTRDRWSGDGPHDDLQAPTRVEPSDAEAGWTRVDGALEDALLARETTDAIGACWGERSVLAQ